MRNLSSSGLTVLRNRRGVAFPVALFAIIASGVLLTAVLVSGATEVGISGAHQDGTRHLYAAEAGIESYVAEQGLLLAPVTDVPYHPPGADPQDEVLITVRLLGSMPPDHPNAQPNWPPDRLYSVEAQPVRGGRTVIVTARVISTVLTLRNEVDAAVVSEADIRLNGSKTIISDGSDSKVCDPAEAAGHAIQIEEGAAVDTGTAKVVGKVGELEGNPYGWVNDMLGTTFQNLIANADVRLDKAMLQANSNITSFNGVADLNYPQNTPNNWGCPQDLMVSAPKQCENDTDISHFPIIAIDASNPNGSWGTVKLNVHHGQGMLVVYNGNLEIAGNLVFKGLILVEGHFTVHASGGGANQPKIEGSIIGLGQGDGLSLIEEDTTMEIIGAPTIRYNRCAIDLVVKMISEEDKFDRQAPRTSGWFEAVR